MRATGTVTVLFTDIVGSTELRARVGADQADELRRTHDGLLAAAVAAHSGVLVKGLGDGIMATFTSAADGVDAAVAIQQAIHRHNQHPLHEPLSVRAGLSIGDVVWEADGDCFGDPVIEASRLCAAAAGGQVLAADVLRVLARQREQLFRSVGELELRGIVTPVAAAEVLWEPLRAVQASTPMPELLDVGSRLSLSGRADELRAVTGPWKSALAGERQVVVVAGEPGIGKTRLCREVAVQAHELGALVLYGRCEEDLGAPYQPFVEALRFFVTRSAPEGLAERLGRYPGDLVRLCPEIGEVIPGLPPALRADPDTERYRLFEAVASWLAAAAQSDGLVLVVDDLHWATRPTLVLLQHVLNAAPEARLLVLGTYRDTDLGRQDPLSGLLAELRRQAGVTRVALTGLDLEGVQELVQDAAGHELDEGGLALADILRNETEGNPFFLNEILRHLRESNVIFVRDGRWVSNLTAAELGIPEGVREVVGRRLDRLSTTANTALTVAAVVGRDFDLDVVCAAAALDEDSAVAALDEALRARLIEEIGVGSYRFAHALVRSTLYDDLRTTRRARMHAQVAATIEQLRPDDVVALAHHYVRAHDSVKGVVYCERAGDEAMAQLAHDRAIDDYRQAIELIEGDPEQADRRCGLMVSLGEAQRRGGDAGYRETLLSAAAVAIRVGNDRQLIRAALANSRGFWSLAGETDDERVAVLEAAVSVAEEGSTDRARLLATLAVDLMFGREADRRHQIADEAVATARATGDQVALVDVLLASIPANYVPWRLPVALASSAELVELTERLGDPQRWAMANVWRFAQLMLAGDVVQADPHLELALQIADDLGEPALRWLVAEWHGLQVLLHGDLDAAEAQLQVGLDLGERSGQPDAFSWYAGQLWVLQRERGTLSDLLPVVEAELEQNPGLTAWLCVLAVLRITTGDLSGAREIFDQLTTPDGRLSVADDILWFCIAASCLEVCEAVGATDKAGALYDQLLPYRHLSAHCGVSYLGSAERYLAYGARTLGRLDDAVAHLEAAVAFEERMQAPTWLGVALADLARTLRARGAVGDAARADEAQGRALQLAEQTGSVFIRRRLAGFYA